MTGKESESFIDQIKKNSGQDISACYQCQKCTAGCPVASYMDVPPNAIHRFLQFGYKDELLKSNAIWLCAACETCGKRCPNDINTAKVIDTLKHLANKEGIRGKEKSVPVMHSVFLSGIKKRGRMHEISLIRDMRLRSGGYFKDMDLGIKMFRMGKLSLIGEKVKNIKEVRNIFKKARRVQ